MPNRDFSASPSRGNDTLLTRDEFVTALKDAGVPFASSTLSSMKARGEGPPTVMVGRLPLYPLLPGLAWARERAARPRKAA